MTAGDSDPGRRIFPRKRVNRFFNRQLLFTGFAAETVSLAEPPGMQSPGMQSPETGIRTVEKRFRF